MDCKKCKKEINSDSKYCSNCGTEKESKSDFGEMIDSTCNNWFMMGFLRGVFSTNKKELEKFENILKKNFAGLWERYSKANNSLKEFIKEANEKNNKAIRPKRKIIPSAERMQKE